MYDFQVATSETDTSLALRCQWETPGAGGFTYSCHVPDRNSSIDCPANNPNNITSALKVQTLGAISERIIK